MSGEKYKNIILVGAIIAGLFAFMIFTWIYVIGDINKGRSCIRTCDKPITKAHPDPSGTPAKSTTQ